MPQNRTASPDPSSATGTHLPAAEALRIAAQLTDTEEDLHAITRVVLALVGADDDLTGDAADVALKDAGVPGHARRLLMAALGPAAGRPTVTELRTGLEAAVVELKPAAVRERTGLAGLIDELQGRRVIRTAFWYVGGSAAMVEAANVFVPMLGAPEGIVRMLAIVAACGLPVALTLSWVYDVAPARTGAGRLSRFAMIGVAVALSIAASVVLWRGGPPEVADAESAGPARVADPAHVAVLGFDAIGSDPDLEAFAQQLQLRLIDGLSAAAMGMSRTRSLRVLSYAGVLPFSRGNSVIDSLRESRGVGTVLSGDVARIGGRLRVSVRLVDAQTGDQIHASTTEVPAADRLGLLDAVADSVVHLVRARLGPVVREHMRLLETKSARAFDRFAWAQRRLDEFEPAFDRRDYAAATAVLSDVDSMLALAERDDPAWIEPIVARGRLANKQVRLTRMHHDTAATLRAVSAGIAHAHRALALKPNDPRALELRGMLRQLHLQAAGPHNEVAVDDLRAAAEQDLRASLVNNASPAAALRMLSELAGGDGRLEEALQLGEQAYRQDPFMEQVQFTVFRLFEYSFAARQDSTAARWCREGRRRFDHPIFDDCRLALGAWSASYPLTPDSAWLTVAGELAAYPAPMRPNLEPRLHAMVAAVLVRAGMPDSARVLLRAARTRDDTPGVLRAAAGVFALLGEPDSAVTMLRTLLHDRPADRRTLPFATELRPLSIETLGRAVTEQGRSDGS